MLKFANQRSKVEGINYKIMDVMDQVQAKKAANQFDRIFAIHLAYWVPNTRQNI